MENNNKVFLLIFESKDVKSIDKILSQLYSANKNGNELKGVNFMIYEVDDDKLKMIFAALEAAK